MKEIKKFDHRDILERELIQISVDDLSEIFPLPKRENTNFALLLVMDGREETVGDLDNIPKRLIEEGLVYLCTWGKDCARIHDIFDKAAIQKETESKKELTIMTTWHNDESIDETLWYFLYNTLPDEEYYEICKTAYIVSVANDEWKKQLENGLSDIKALVKRVVR